MGSDKGGEAELISRSWNGAAGGMLMYGRPAWSKKGRHGVCSGMDGPSDNPTK